MYIASPVESLLRESSRMLDSGRTCLIPLWYGDVCDSFVTSSDSLRGSSVEVGTMQRILARPLRKDDTHTHTHREV